MITIPAGSFMMGSKAGEGDDDEHGANGGQLKVSIAKPFAVSKFEVTFDQWDACLAQGGCKNTASYSSWGRGDRPVINVSWHGAKNYVKWLSELTRQNYRLLSEAEWEYVARAGSQTIYAWGDEIGKKKANCDGCGSQWGGQKTAPVGSFGANKFGLHDMHGNVWEWVEDCYQNSYKGAPTDGSARAAKTCDDRVLRGGSWNDNPRVLRSANRYRFRPVDRVNVIGFRVARSLSSPRTR
ncbi:MAG: formylglycine-generating enzyme family protein [bacterium]|nr:formylglycine-generating enzyme family protein [bacterium]